MGAVLSTHRCARGRHMWGEKGTVQSAENFMSTAKRFNLVSRLDQWGLQGAMTWLARHRAALSKLPLRDQPVGPLTGRRSIGHVVVQQVNNSGVPPDKLSFAITE